MPWLTILNDINIIWYRKTEEETAADRFVKEHKFLHFLSKIVLRGHQLAHPEEHGYTGSRIPLSQILIFPPCTRAQYKHFYCWDNW
jgi:hypothetical protein